MSADLEKRIAQAIQTVMLQEPGWCETDLARATLAAIVAAGAKVMFREPTEAMAKAWAALAFRRIRARLMRDNDDGAVGVVEGAKESYRAMWDAAPSPPNLADAFDEEGKE